MVYNSESKYCPICESQVQRFNDFNKRKNALCPTCGSLERHRLLWLFLSQETKIFNKRATLLHFAPESCIKQGFLRHENIQYISADIKFNRKPTVKTDIQETVFGNDIFDFVYCSHVLEHVPDDKKAMKEIYRILKPGGSAILMVPIQLQSPTTLEDPSINTPELRAKHYGQHDHLRFYGLDFKDRLESVGFDVSADKYADKFEESVRQRHRLGRGHIIYHCHKNN